MKNLLIVFLLLPTCLLAQTINKSKQKIEKKVAAKFSDRVYRDQDSVAVNVTLPNATTTAAAALSIAQANSATATGGAIATINSSLSTIKKTEFAFTTAIPFTSQNGYMYTTQTGSLTFTANTVGAIPGGQTLVHIVANGTNIPQFDPAFIQVGSGTWDNTANKNHDIIFYTSGTNFYYGILVGSLADVVAPTLVSAQIGNATPDKVTLTYNENLYAGGTVSPTSFTLSPARSVTSVSVSGVAVSLNLSAPYSATDVITLKYVAPTSGKITDASFNPAANLTGRAVSNDIIASNLLEDIVFTTTTSGLTNVSGVWSGTIAATYGNQGVAARSLAAGASGYVQYGPYNGAGNNGQDLCMFGFKLTGTLGDGQSFHYGISIQNGVLIVGVSGNSTINTGIAVVIGNYYRVRRLGSTLTVDTTSDPVNVAWTTVYTYAITSSAKLYIATAITNLRKMNYPKGYNLNSMELWLALSLLGGALRKKRMLYTGAFLVITIQVIAQPLLLFSGSPGIERFKNANIVGDGNSLMFGLAVSGTGDIITQLSQQAPFSTNGSTFTNFGVSGQTTSQMLSDVVTQVDPTFNPNVRRNILLVWEGGNDLYTNGDVTGAYNRLFSYCNARKAVGWYVVLLTCPPRDQVAQYSGGTSADFDAKMVALNTLLLTNYRLFCHQIVDVRSIPGYENQAAINNVFSYYQSDKIHMNAAGYAAIVTDVANGLLTKVLAVP